MKKLNFIIKCGLALLLLSFYSCESWLNVTPSDRLSEEMLFNDREGFVKALNGVYIELLNSSLYGGTLSYKTFDILAQYYDCDKDEQTWQKLSTFDQTAKKGQVSGLWSKVYTLLVNVNTIIEACDERKEVLNSEYYQKRSDIELELYIGDITNRYGTFAGNTINSLTIADCTQAVFTTLDKEIRKKSKAK